MPTTIPEDLDSHCYLRITETRQYRLQQPNPRVDRVPITTAAVYRETAAVYQRMQWLYLTQNCKD
jgi:hypothetical protein